MKKLFLIAIAFLSIQYSFAQNLRNNKFDLPVVENEIAFFTVDSVPNLTKADFDEFSKDWFLQTFTTVKYTANNQPGNNNKAGVLAGNVTFKIDDPNIKSPLNYTARVTVKFINGVATMKLHALSYTTADSKSKNATNVTYEVKQQMLAKTDALYPGTWDSLKKYANELLQNFVDFMYDKNIEKL